MQPPSNSLRLEDYIRAIPDFPKPGILFRDITPLLAHPGALRQVVCQMSDYARRVGAGAVAAAEARGFLFAAPMALHLQIPLIPIRKRGKLPYKVLSHTYDLEYGSDTLEIHTDAVPAGSSVLLVDDLLATGGTMAACCELVEKAGGKVAGCAFLIELAELNGAAALGGRDVFSVLKF